MMTGPEPRPSTRRGDAGDARPVRRRLVVGMATATVLIMWAAPPALAHGDEGESDPVNQVEQALAIVVNTPQAADEALERIEAALDTEEGEPSGELDIPALEAAAAALEDGRWHEAEDELILALGQDPHAVAIEPGLTDATGSESGPPAHGLTERVGAELRFPSTGGWSAIGAAVVAAVIGSLILRRKESSHGRQ